MSEPRDPLYDVTLVRVRPRTVPQALARLAGWLEAREQGDLVGCFFSELGTVNQILMLRRFADIRALLGERAQTPLSADPLGISELTLELTRNIAVAMPDAGQGPARGPYFEVRTDVLKPGSLGRALHFWQAALRHASPAFGAYTIAGDRLSIVHIWPWATLDERAQLVDDPLPINIWRAASPSDAPVSQRAEIFRAAAFSPMQ